MSAQLPLNLLLTEKVHRFQISQRLPDIFFKQPITVVTPIPGGASEVSTRVGYNTARFWRWAWGGGGVRSHFTNGSTQWFPVVLETLLHG